MRGRERTGVGIDTSMCQDARLGLGRLGDVLARAQVCHDSLVDLAVEKRLRHRVISRLVRPSAVWRATYSTVDW